MTQVMFFKGQPINVKLLDNKAYHKCSESKIWYKWEQSKLNWKRLPNSHVPTELQ